jgi:hypothetical protein
LIDQGWGFPKGLLGTTYETDIPYDNVMMDAPHPLERMLAMLHLKERNRAQFITIEPIMDFAEHEFARRIKMVRPEFVNIGADSKKHNLPEPTSDKINALISEIQRAGIEIREKHNLDRLVK